MRVALDVSAVPQRLAGAGRYVAELARRLPPSGVATTVVARRGDAERWRTMSPNALVTPIVPSGRVARLAFEAWALGTSRPARDVDVWHGPHYTMPRRGATPTVVTVHDLTFFTHPEWHERSKVVFFQRAITYAARHARVLVCVSDFTARELDAIVPDHPPVVVAPHGVDLARFSPESLDDEGLLARNGLATDVAFIFFVGTVEPRKGLDVLLSAFARLAGDHPNVELWLAGQPGWGMDEFDGLVAASGAAARVRRLGFVEDVVLPALLRRARAVVYPSRGEGFGLPVLEAMACGAPVVTTAQTVMAEVADSCATLTRAGDVTGLADALDEVLRLSAEARAELGRASRARASRFTWEASLESHHEAYQLALRGL